MIPDLELNNGLQGRCHIDLNASSMAVGFNLDLSI